MEQLTVLLLFSCFSVCCGVNYGGYPQQYPVPYDTYPPIYYNEPYRQPAAPYGGHIQHTYPSNGYIDQQPYYPQQPQYSDNYAPSYRNQYQSYDQQTVLKSGYGGGGSHSGGHQGGGYGQTSYVPVVKKTKKKQKIISIDKGLFIAGGTQAFGKFKSLKSCMKACASSPACFAGDYNPWLGKCYFHGNITACNTMSTHSKLTHFKKIPCAVPGAPRSLLVLGAQLFGGVVQKGIKSLTDCLKKCVNSGGGIASAPTALALPGQGGQICFGIDYDFGSHKCYFHVVNRRRVGVVLSALCPETAVPAIFTPVDLVANPSVVHILLCPAM